MENNQVVITPHEGQAKVLLSTKRFILAAAGIQGGKTFAGCIWSQMEIQRHPTGNGLITALSHDQLNNSVLDKFFSIFPQYKQYYNKKERCIYLPTGGKIFVRSLEDPKYVEGITANWAWMDEADLCGYKAYLIVRGRLNATGGRLLMTSSISDSSWLAEYFDKFDPKEFDIITWASVQNPSFSKEEWESLKAELDPVLFRRRYEAQLSFASGRVYGNFDFNKYVVDKIPADDPVIKVFLGFDWGYNDPTAIIPIGISLKKNIYVIEDFMVEGMYLDPVADITKNYIKRYHIKGFYGDPSNKIFLNSVAKKVGITIQPGNNDIFSGTSMIRNLIFQGRFFVLKQCVHVLNELKRYKFKEGLITRSEEPEDSNNHTLDAIRYVLATYPVPSVKLPKLNADGEEAIPFWQRRSEAYRKEVKRQKVNIIGTGQAVLIP